MAILGNWVCLPGVRRTNGGSVHFFDLICDTTQPENGLNRVEFAISVNGVAHSTQTVTVKTKRIPNFSEAPSLMPDGEPAWFMGYGFGMLMSSYPAGYIQVTATAFSNAGNSFSFGTMSVYNDSDGVDRRPRQVTVYVDGDVGVDTNAGTSWPTAVKTIGKAIQLARAPSGECGGAIVRCRGTITDISGGIYNQTHTSGDWWMEFRAEPGCRMDCRSPTANGPRYWSAGGTGSVCRQRIIGFDWSPVCSAIGHVWGGSVHNWFDNCSQTALGYLGENDWSVRYAFNGGDGSFIGFDGSFTTSKRYFTGVMQRGARIGFEQSSLLYNCICRDFIGIAAKTGSLSGPFMICNFGMMAQRYVPRTVRGYVRMDGSSNGFPRPALTVTKPTPDTARITGPVSGYDFSLDAADLVGCTDYTGAVRYGLRFENSGLGLDTPTSALTVTAVGNTGGAPWVEVTAPSAAAGSIPANTCSFYTANPVNGFNYWYLHPDGIQYESNILRGTTANCFIVDCPGMQSYFTSGYNQELALWLNLRDSGTGNDLNWNQAVGQAGTLKIQNCLVKNCTFVGQMQTNVPTWTGTEVVNNCFGSAGGTTDLAPSNGATFRYNHWRTGTAVGSNATTGSWFAGDQTISPFSFAPSSGNLATGAPDITDLPEVRYSASGSTRGVTREIGNLDWTDPTSGGLPDRVAQATTTIGLAYAAQSLTTCRASSAYTLPLSYVATAVNRVVAQISGPTKQTISLSYEFRARLGTVLLPNTAEAVTTIGLSYDFRSQNLTGAAAALFVIPITGVISALNRVSGSASHTLPITGEVSAATATIAQASATIGISGTITGVLGAPVNTAQATTTISVSGSSSAINAILARATGTIGISVTMAGRLGEKVKTAPSPRRNRWLDSLLRRMPRTWRWQ